MLALVNDQRRSVEGQLTSFVPAIVLSWGIAWFLGFSTLWLIDGPAPAFSLPTPLAIAIFATLIGVAVVVSVVLGARSGRGIRENTGDSFQGVVYGISWFIGAVVIVVFAQGLAANGMTLELANVYFPVAFVLFTGLMYVLAGAMWHTVAMLVLGIWTITVGLAAPFLGYPNHYLVLAVGGGAGLFAFAVASFTHLARLRRNVTHSDGTRHG